jgi:hypothetical protein
MYGSEDIDEFKFVGEVGGKGRGTTVETPMTV